MKVNKFIGIGCVLAGLLGSFALGTTISNANEKKIYIYDDQLRADLVNAASYNPETGEEIVIENELPTVKQLENVETLSFFRTSSIEGIQYAKNLKWLMFYAQAEEGQRDVIDLRPIGELTNLQFLQCYSYYSQDESTYAVQDISYMKNLKKLESLDLYHFPVLDLTPLSDLENLSRFDTNTYQPVKINSIAIDRNEKKCVLEHPVKYSKQFDGGEKTAQIIDEEGNELVNSTIVMNENKIVIENISEEMTDIYLKFHANSADNYFRADTVVQIPIFWY